MSDPVRPDLAAFAELQQLTGLLAEELAAFRRRALAAEQKAKELVKSGDTPTLFAPGAAHERVSALEAENAQLKERLTKAADRTKAMLDRVRFLRQQHLLEVVADWDFAVFAAFVVERKNPLVAYAGEILEP